MIIGIVGSEAAKFTELGKSRAKNFIQTILSAEGIAGVASGACHLGGIDIWAVEIGRKLGLQVQEFPPADFKWSSGYRARNVKIARASDVVWCITVDSYPLRYAGMKFDFCYHCMTNQHIKSGGCWTMKHAEKIGKQGRLKVIQNGEAINLDRT